MRPAWLLLPASLALLGGCPLAHPPVDPQSCLRDEDCFAGELCYPPTRRLGEPGQCQPRLDRGVPDARRRDTGARPEAAPPDGARDIRTEQGDLGRDLAREGGLGDG